MNKFATTTLAAAAIGLAALVAAPQAAASEKSDCAAKGGTYTETIVYDQGTGKTGTNYRCCVKDTATNTTTCTSTTVTKAEMQPTGPGTRVPVGVFNGQLQQAQLSQGG
ncbi:hypothetical protein [Mycolicibacterium sp. 120270]|uniref:hypothetical protein n=1 Tax=Mycolicibacterium sp. 120270 TaxID=3090600 RepID=UPI00299D2D52|nr:hypothetical protein [Mycolicibacterium sp. 120270]MDX1885827.1 hypothetical protein [Mycolicibacterium sp. 120270]